MRVLHLLASNSLSGAEQVVINIARLLGEEVHAVYASPDGPIRGTLTDRGVAYHPLRGLNVPAVRNAIRAHRPNVIHAHDYQASCIAALTPTFVPILSHLHNNYPWAQRLNARTAAYGLCLHRFRRVLAVSHAVIDEHFCRQWLARKSMVVPNVIDARFILEAAQAEEETHSDVIFVGRFTAQKNPQRFIRIVEGLRREHPEVRAVMVGDGELRAECETMARSLGLENAVGFVGFRANPYSLIAASKVLVQCSDWEGFGLAALEGQILGRPVVASRVGGLVDIVDDARTGYLCNDEGEFVPRISSLLAEDDAARTRREELCRERAAVLNDIAGFRATLMDCYRSAESPYRHLL